GRRAYDLARREQAVALEAVPVHVTRAEVSGFDGTRATIGITCSAGFYVRSFAHALGQLVGTGACLEALQRTRSGDFGIDCAVTLQEVVERPERAWQTAVSLDSLLASFPAVLLSEDDRRRVSHGQEVTHGAPATSGAERPPDWVRLLD